MEAWELEQAAERHGDAIYRTALQYTRQPADAEDVLQEVLLERRMPPWHADPHHGKFANDRSLTAGETQTLLRWIKQGCPRGNGEDPLERTAAAAADSDGELDEDDRPVRHVHRTLGKP